jgi:hypothetical protein
MTETVNERDIVATNEMIRNLRAGTFKKMATGTGIAGALLLAGASLLVWTWKHGNDPEALKEALRHMPPLNVTVTLDPDSRVVTLAEGGTVRLEQPSVMPRAAATVANANNDPAIQTSVTVFKTVKYETGEIITGWQFANGAAKTPNYQYCYFKQATVGGRNIQDIAADGKLTTTPAGVTDQKERFTHCQWFSGELG